MTHFPTCLKRIHEAGGLSKADVEANFGESFIVNMKEHGLVRESAAGLITLSQHGFVVMTRYGVGPNTPDEYLK